MSDVLTRFRTKREPEKVPPAPKQRAEKPPFAPVPLDEAAPYFRAIDSASGAVVVTLLFYVAWKTKDRTFPLSNELCARYGVSRWAASHAFSASSCCLKISAMPSGWVTINSNTSACRRSFAAPLTKSSFTPISLALF